MTDAIGPERTLSRILRIRLSSETVEITFKDKAEIISVPSPALTKLSAPGRVRNSQRVTPDQPWVKAISRAYGWRRQLERREVTTIAEIAAHMGVKQRYIAQLISLGWMAPDLIEGILDGSIQPAIPLSYLKTENLPLDWDGQRRIIAPKILN